MHKLIELVIILVCSTAAVFLPVVGSLPPKLLFVARHLGSGVILATGLVHLLEPADEALKLVCEFPLAYALSLAMIFVIVVVDAMQKRSGHSHGHSHGYTELEKQQQTLGSLLVLESGIVFHSLFIGISCALAEGPALGIAISIHQSFEGLGLGARLASIEWDAAWKPRALAWLYALATPFGMLVGLVQIKVTPILTGVFDALSSGVLLYTGLVELMANELVGESLNESLGTWATAYVSTALGAAAMTALAYWV